MMYFIFGCVVKIEYKKNKTSKINSMLSDESAFGSKKIQIKPKWGLLGSIIDGRKSLFSSLFAINKILKRFESTFLRLLTALFSQPCLQLKPLFFFFLPPCQNWQPVITGRPVKGRPRPITAAVPADIFWIHDHKIVHVAWL